MIFDDSKVYTALNAIELSTDDIVYLADTVRELKQLVSREDKNFTTVDKIFNEDVSHRFVDNHYRAYNLAYLVCPARNAEAFKAWHEGKKIEMEYTEPDENKSLVWKLFENAKPDWYEANYRPAQEEEYRPFATLDELIAEFKKRFQIKTPSYALPLIWVKLKSSIKSNNDRGLITGYIDNEGNGQLVKIGDKYYGLKVLFDSFNFLDGSPCGVEK